MEDNKFKYFQKKIIEHLSELEAEENREESRISKSLATQEFFDKMMKSRGYEVGTVREWKGKKYKKIAQNKWVRVYDKDSSSARRSIGQIKHMAEKCTTSQELLQLVLKYRDRFSDENGHPLPVVQELSEYVSGLNDKLAASEGKKTKKKESQRDYKEGQKLSNGKTVKEMREKYGIKTKNEKKAEKEEKTENDSAFKGSNLETVAAKYATDKEIAKLVKKTDSVDFTSQDVSRFFMCGTYQDNGYVIATDGKMLSMIKADYPSEEKWKVKGNAKIMKQIAKDVENYKAKKEQAETRLAEAEEKFGRGSGNYKFALEDVEEAKKDLASAEEQLKTGFVDGQFPNYKRVIPDESVCEPAEGFEDFDRVMKTAMIAAAYRKFSKRDVVPVKVGNKYFDAGKLAQCMAMAKKHGLTNVITPENDWGKVLVFSGKNGVVELMPMADSGWGGTIFYGDRGTAKFGEGENSEEFLSAGEKESKLNTVLNTAAIQKKLYSGFVSDVYNKILEMTGNDRGEGKRKLKLGHNGNLNFYEADYMFNKTWDEETQKKHRTDFIEKYGTEKGNKIIDAILAVQKLTNWVFDYKMKISDGLEENRHHSRDVENYIKEQTSKIRAKLGMQKSMPIIMIRKSVYEDCMKLLRG